MKFNPLFVAALTAALCSPAQAADLPLGGWPDWQNLAFSNTDSSFVGTLVAAQTREVVVLLQASTHEPRYAVRDAGDVVVSVSDYVIRRHDTGTLDFYAALTADSNFYGSFSRSVSQAGETPAATATVGYVATGSRAPGRAWYGAGSLGASVGFQYPEGWFSSTNFLASGQQGAALVYRSTATEFNDRATGYVDYRWADQGGSGLYLVEGSAQLQMFGPGIAPVPEPASIVLMLAGCGVLVAGTRRRRPR